MTRAAVAAGTQGCHRGSGRGGACSNLGSNAADCAAGWRVRETARLHRLPQACVPGLLCSAAVQHALK